MDIAEVQASPRQAGTSRVARRLRKQALVPAVLYGRQQDNVLLSLHRDELENLIRAHTSVVQVVCEGQTDAAQIRDVQYDALGDRVLHVDFVRISLTEIVTVSVPVEPHGEPPGVTAGGLLELRMHELEVECLPIAIPEKVRIEVGALEITDDLRVGQIEFPEGVTPTADPEAVVAVVSPPVGEEEEEEEEGLLGEITAEPEIIGRVAGEEEPEAEGEG